MDGFLTTIGALKNLPRRGWVKRGVPDPESVADHMYQMAMICLTYPWVRLRRAMSMVLVHDAPETIAGDVTPSDGVKNDQKREREELGLDFIACLLRNAGNPLADRVEDLWNEYELHKSHVSVVVHQIDELDLLQQAFPLHFTRHPELQLRDFRGPEVLDAITDDYLKGIADEVVRKWDVFESRRRSRRASFILVVGGPGVGKGTQCARAAVKYELAHISIGDLLRREQADEKSHFKEFISKSIAKRVVVPPALVMKPLARELDSAQTRGRCAILLDGFPRSEQHLDAFEQEVKDTYSTFIMDCDENNMLGRLTFRAQTSKREDDDAARLRDRINKFSESDKPVWERLSAPKTYKIDCNGSIGEVEALFRQ
ncbi:P-loop containing nucleoside triphosphate hydrolase protein [Coniochaeta sp. PMI_546]|nr:P-loop containing nucleoside triphosphate hydrolase protein [Coniochaeta sp. PMI_546]